MSLLTFFGSYTQTPYTLQPKFLNLNNAHLIGDGNSYMAGHGYAPAISYLMGMEPFNSNGATMVNFGVGGQSTQDMLADQATQVLPAMQPGVVNLFLIMEGGNDLYYGRTPQQALANTKTYCRNIKNIAAQNNIDAWVLIYNLIPRNQPDINGTVADFNTNMESYNLLISGDTSNDWDEVIDLKNEPLFSAYNAGGYDADEIHPNGTGQEQMAVLTHEKIMSLQKR